MKPRRIFFAARLSLPLATALVALLSARAAHAGSATWNQTVAATYTWGTNANWSPNTTFPNATTDVASINNNIAGNIIISLASGTAANRTVGDLNLGDSTGTSTFTIQPGVTGSLLIFGGARTMDVTGAGANTISAGIRASGGNLTFRSTAAAETTISGGISTTDTTNRSITFNNDINGTATAAATAQGQFGITAATTLRGTTGTLGTTTVNDVRVRGTVANAFGSVAGNTVTVAGAGQVYLTGGTHVNNLVLNSTGWGETAGNFGALRIENATVSGTVTLQQNTIIGVHANNTGTLSGVVSGNFGITKVGGTSTSGQGELLLSNANTFTGPVTVDRGTVRASNAAALGTNADVTVNASPTAGGDGNRLALSGTITIGAGKTLTLNSTGTGDFRSMLINTANNNTWAGDIVASGNGLTQASAASNTTLTISGDVTSTGGSGTGTLFSRGAGTVVYDGVINLGTDRLFTRTDAGTAIVNSTGNSWVSTRVANGQIQIGANNALASVPFAFGEGNGNNGRLELNGFNQTVTSLSTFATSTGTNHIIRNSNPTSPSTLTFATPDATTDLLKNVQIQGTASGFGTLNLVKNGLGRTEFEGGLVAADSWTVNDGTVAFTGANNQALPGDLTGAVTATIEKAGATTLVSTGTWNHAGTTNIAGGTLVLGGGSAGAINLSDTATLTTGLGGGALSSTAVTLGTAGATAYVPLLTTAGAPAPLDAASLTANGTVTVTPQAGVFSTGTYRLLDYNGTIGGAGSGAFALSGVATYPHMTAALDFTTAG
jgi:fibronectin-binding autotransporter adhesin